MTAWVSGLILAAGSSSRLGQPKPLLTFRGTTLLGWVLDRVATARALDEVVVVLGGAAAEVRARVNLDRARVVENPDFGRGCASSYQTGIGALDSRAEAVVVVPGDQPGIEAGDIDRVVRTWREGAGPIVVASYLGRRGHPLLFARRLFNALIALKGDKAAWKLLDAHAEWVRAIELDRPLPPDINTWQDYRAVLASSASPAEGLPHDRGHQGGRSSRP